MIYKSSGVNVSSNQTILTAPADKKIIIVSMNVSNKSVSGDTFSIKINKGVDMYYLLKDSYIHPNSLTNIISEELYLDKGDSILIEATGVDLDIYTSYKELVIFS